MFNLFRNSLGQVDSINRISDGASVAYNLGDKSFGNDEITLEFLTWQKENNIDLSDIEDDPIPEVITYKLNYLVSSDRSIPLFRFPEDINYNTDLVIGLTTKTIDYFGLRVAQILYQSLNVETLEPIEPIPIVLEKYLYTWDKTTGFATSRIKQIYFYQSDEQLSDRFKVLPKEFYSTSDKAEIGNKRRKAIVDYLVARSVELGLGDALKGFFTEYKDECDRYILYADKTILTIIAGATQPWWNADTKTPVGSVRNAISYNFNKALEATNREEIDLFLAGLIG